MGCKDTQMKYIDLGKVFIFLDGKLIILPKTWEVNA